MEKKDVILTLLEAIKFFREQYLSSAYSTMGFTVISVGWLVTSQSARAFLHTHRWLGVSAILGLVVSFIGYFRSSLAVQSASQGIADQLDALGVDASVYGHYVLSLEGVQGFIFLQGVAILFLSLTIIAVLRDPGQE